MCCSSFLARSRRSAWTSTGRRGPAIINSEPFHVFGRMVSIGIKLAPLSPMPFSKVSSKVDASAATS